jgi:hypothetical protein
VVALAVVCCLGAGLAPVTDLPGADGPSVAGAPTENGSTAEPSIVAVYPDPPTYDDVGEFVTVEFPPGSNVTAYALADEHSAVPLPGEANSTVGTRTRITFSTAAEHTRELTDRTVRALPNRIQLANDGEKVRLLRSGEPVDTAGYARAAEAEVYDPADGEWRPLGATDRPVVSAGSGEVEAFALPDQPDRAVEFLDSAEERLYLAGYTLTSERVVDALVRAHERGVAVRVLVEGGPVGGMSAPAGTALDELERAGIEVRVVGGKRARYRYHHAKYAVVDARALVTTENWKRSGTGGRSSRGWGVITDQRAVVDGLAETFEADAGWVDAVPWHEFDRPALVEEEPASGSYPSEFQAESFDVERSELLVAPDNAEARLREVIGGAEESIAIKQVRIGSEAFPLLREVIAAAERGVEVRVLLSGAWYVEEGNRRFVRRLEEQASRDGLPIQARVAEPGDRFEKIHAKGMIVDGERTVVGSLNWNNNSLRANREVALLIESEKLAAYFGDVFDADWEGRAGRRELPAGLALAALFAGTVAVLVASRLRFEGRG